MIEEPQRQLAAAIVHVVKDRAVPFRWIDGSQQIDVGLELDLPGGVARGEIEIDDDAAVSMSEDGAYVQGWLWVADEEKQEDD